MEDHLSDAYKLHIPLRVVGLRGSVPPIWLKDFVLSQGKRVRTKFEYQGGLQDIFSAMASALKKKQVKANSIFCADLVTIGDSWLQNAISGGLIEPVHNAEQHDWCNRLGPKWKTLLRRDERGCLDSQGLIWAVPYRWGSTVIAYKKDKLAKNNVPEIQDWKDLWKPGLTGKIAMVDSPREVVGAVLKSLGASYNTKDFEKEVKGGKEAVERQYLAFQKQVKLFDSDYYLKALGAGNVWVAIGWSSDVIPVVKRMSDVRVIVPESGTSLWADLWAIPATTTIPTDKIGSRAYGASPLIHQWFDFCLQPIRALPFVQGVFMGASPLYLGQSTTDGELKNNKGYHPISVEFGLSRKNGPKVDINFIDGMPPPQILSKCEFLEPLSEKAKADYTWLISHNASPSWWPFAILKAIKTSLMLQFVRKDQSR